MMRSSSRARRARSSRPAYSAARRSAPVTSCSLRRSYPVYRRGYKAELDVITRYLAGVHAVTPIGRYGAFKYNNQDHSILMGLLAADNIAGGAHHDLWAINSDYEYQEAAVITATGLAPA